MEVLLSRSSGRGYRSYISMVDLVTCMHDRNEKILPAKIFGRKRSPVLDRVDRLKAAADQTSHKKIALCRTYDENGIASLQARSYIQSLLFTRYILARS